MRRMSVIPNAEPFELRGGEIAVLMIHGFTGSPASVRPWAEALNQAGFTVTVPLLPGHGRTWEEMNRTRWEQWFAEVERTFEELKQRHKRIFVAGFSMGGALSIRLAAMRGPEIEGLLLVNPSIFDERPALKAVPILKYFIPSIGGRGTDVAAPNPPKHSYGRTPLHALHSLQKLWRTVQRDLASVQTPLMIGYSINDHVVDPKNSEHIIDNVASVDIREVIFERSYHNVALDHDAEILASESIAFIRDVLSGRVERDENELIDAEFDSIVAGLNLDASSPSTYLDELENLESGERYEGDNKPLPTLTPIQRGALLGVTLGPTYAAITSLTSIDPLGLRYWPGLIALLVGVVLFFWQMKPDSDGDEGIAI
jgi:carboxylesterase